MWGGEASVFHQLTAFITDMTGMVFPEGHRAELERKFMSVAKELGFTDIPSCFKFLASSPFDPIRIQVLADHLVVGETYFFREKTSFALLEASILPGLIQRRRQEGKYLRIWSAGCCTGEEPYSLAIQLTRMIPDWQDWHITILATDINAHFLEKAVRGIYSEWSFRDTPPEIKETFFRKHKDNQYELHAHIKELVRFSYLNLVEDVYPSSLNGTQAMDIILCRNVLMYFSPEHALKVTGRLHEALIDYGWLIPGLCEVSSRLYPQFASINSPEATVYRKVPPRKTTGRARLLPTDTADQALRTGVCPYARPVGQVPSTRKVGSIAKTRKAPLLKSTPQDGDVLTSSSHEAHEVALAHDERGEYADLGDRIFLDSSDWKRNPRTTFLLARAYANQGKLVEALAWCEKAVKADPMDTRHHYLHATILQEMGRVDEAIASLKRILYLDPDDVLAYFALGHLSHQQAKNNIAAKYFENVVTLLRRYQPGDIIPESDGMTAGRLLENTLALIEERQTDEKSFGSR
jgi:chemotaxis protein methyltransferase CheR